MKIAVVGSRDFFLIYDYKSKKYIVDSDKRYFVDTILIREFRNFAHNPDHELTNMDITIVSGGAKGVDQYAEQFAMIWNLKTKIFKPDWNRYGNGAGFIRNQLIIDEADKVIAFWDRTSKGTKNSIDLAIKAGKPLDVYVR